MKVEIEINKLWQYTPLRREYEVEINVAKLEREWTVKRRISGISYKCDAARLDPKRVTTLTSASLPVQITEERQFLKHFRCSFLIFISFITVYLFQYQYLSKWHAAQRTRDGRRILKRSNKNSISKPWKRIFMCNVVSYLRTIFLILRECGLYSLFFVALPVESTALQFSRLSPNFHPSKWCSKLK